MSLTLYGIPNCDTVKRARKALEDGGCIYSFHDFRKDGLSDDLLADLWDCFGGDLINKRGTTWRALSVDEQAQASDRHTALALLQAKPSLIKRPVWQKGGCYKIGFAKGQEASFLNWVRLEA